MRAGNPFGLPISTQKVLLVEQQVNVFESIISANRKWLLWGRRRKRSRSFRFCGRVTTGLWTYESREL